MNHNFALNKANPSAPTKCRCWPPGAAHRQPITKSKFWSKKNLGRKYEFWSENEDLGVFDIADFKFLGLDTRFVRNLRNRFWILENWFWIENSKIVFFNFRISSRDLKIWIQRCRKPLNLHFRFKIPIFTSNFSSTNILMLY